MLFRNGMYTGDDGRGTLRKGGSFGKKYDSLKVARTLTNSFKSKSSLTKREEGLTRSYYLEVMNSSLDFQTKKDTINKELGKDLGVELDLNCIHKPENVQFWPNSHNKMGQIETCGIITIGRNDQNDIPVNQPNGEISRIQVLVFVYQESLLVLDSWSLNGTKCKDLTTGEEFRSAQNQRVLMAFPRENAVLMTFTQGKVILNPKECVICMEGPRQIKFSCNHAVACEECFAKLTARSPMASVPNCPVCRAPIKFHSFGDYTKTMIPSHSQPM